MLSKEEVKHIAKLARLGLTEKEIEKFQRDLSSILDYVEKLKEIDVSKVKPTSHSVEMENVTRADKTEGINPEERKKIIEQMPETKNGYLKVKQIL
jgi:aspartyl-tRNA(Asn)/glutamyl-tRNA(Gln) amidotransferase subunit C